MSRIAVPRPPEPPPPFQFPVIATIAPVLAAVLLWAITRSPLTLAFAALGPVIAIAGFADSRLSARRSTRRATARFDAELAAAHAAVAHAHEAELAALLEAHPCATALLLPGSADPGRWSGHTDVALGTGELPSALELDLPATNDGPSRAALDALAERAAVLPGAPVVADARAGIGVCGPPQLAHAVARGIAIRLARQLPPDRWWCGERGHAWADRLPHRLGPSPRHEGIRFGDGSGTELFVAVAAQHEELPPGCGAVVVVGAGMPARVTWHPDRAARRAVSVDAATAAEAAAWASIERAQAQAAGLLDEAAGPPDRVDLARLPQPVGSADPGSLASAFLVGSEGPLVVDLVAHGPHAVVGGTTGSGKSELLVSWVLALAARYPPSAVGFLLVDFKGGSAFAPLAELPHTVGTITDLDAAGALRALTSLRAELRYRERTLAEAGARDIAATDRLGRLVIVVDEFAAMLSEHPDLHALFADLAARGRSLGIHLILCTQRPAEAVRDGVLANADLRISLRVNNRADSTAVLGTDEAATIPAEAKGRALVSLAGAAPELVQVARAADGEAARLATRWAGAATARRPWLEPLPPFVSLDAVRPTAEGVAFGLLDRPDLQRREAACWIPQRHGGLLVLGSSGAGASTTLASLAERSGGRWIPGTPEAAWDALAELLDAPPAGVVLVDDLDALVARCSAEHRAEFVDRLVRLAREGPAAGLQLAAAMRRIPGELQVFASLLPARLLLRHASRHDLVLAGGDGAAHDPGLVPGAGTWLGARVQVAVGRIARPADPPAACTKPDPDRPLAVVTTRSAAVHRRLGAAGYRVVGLDALEGGAAAGSALVGDVDEWQSRWGALAAVRPVASVVFDRCSAGDLRQLARVREVPPPIAPDQAWLLLADGEVVRTRLPG